MATSRLKWLRTAGKVLVTAAAIAFIGYKLSVGEVKECVLRADAVWLFGALAVTPVCILLKAVRWWLLTKEVEPAMGFGRALRSLLAGISLAAVTPGGVGELARGLYADSDKGYELTSMALIDKLLDVTGLVVAGAAGLVLFFGYFWILPVVLVAVLLVWSNFAWLAARLGGARLLGRFGGGLSSVRRGTLVRCLGLAVLFFAVYYFQGWMALRSYEPVGERAAALLPVTTAAKIVPAFLGIGPREFVAKHLLPHAGVSDAAAVLGVFSHYVLVTLVPSLFGALWLGRLRLPAKAGTKDEG